MDSNAKVIKKVTPINLKMLEKCGNDKQLMISKLMNAIGKKTVKKVPNNGKVFPEIVKLESDEMKSNRSQIVIHSVEILPSVIDLCDIPDPEPSPAIVQQAASPVKKLKANPHSVQLHKPNTVSLFTQKIPQKDPSQPIKLKMKRLLVKPKLPTAPRAKFINIQRYDKCQTPLVPPIPPKIITSDNILEKSPLQNPKPLENEALISKNLIPVVINTEPKPENPSQDEFYGFLNDDDELSEEEEKIRFFQERLLFLYPDDDGDNESATEVESSVEDNVIIQIEEIQDDDTTEENDGISKISDDASNQSLDEVTETLMIIESSSHTTPVSEIFEKVPGDNNSSADLPEDIDDIPEPESMVVQDEPQISSDDIEANQEVQETSLIDESSDIPVEEIAAPPSPVKLKNTTPRKKGKITDLLNNDMDECRSDCSQEIESDFDVPVVKEKSSPKNHQINKDVPSLDSPKPIVELPKSPQKSPKKSRQKPQEHSPQKEVEKSPNKSTVPSIPPEESANQILRSENELLKRLMKDLIDQIKNKPILHSIDVDELSSFLDNSVSGPEVPVPIPVKLERPEKKEIVQVPFSYDADESELDTTEISNFPATVKRLLSKAEERSIKITSTPKPTKSSEMVHKLSIISINNKSDSSPGKSSNKRSSPSKSHHSPSQPPTIKSSVTKNRDNLPVKSVKVSKSVELPKTANLEIEKTNFKTKFRSESPEKRSKLSKSAESPKSKDREVKIQAESPDKRSKSAKSPDKASTSRPKESTKSLAIPEEELFSSPDLLVSSIPNKRIKLDEVVENTNKKLQVVRHLLPGNVKVIRNTRSSSGESLRNDVSIPEVSSDDEPLKVSMISRSRKRVRNLSASSGSSQDRSLYKRVVKNNHLNSQKISRTISSSTDDLSVNSAKSKAGQSLQNGGSSSDSGMIRKNYIDKVEVEENTEENVENDTAPVKSPKKIKKPTKRKTPVTRIRSPERVAAEERKLEKEQRALRRKVVKVELPPKVQQSRGLIYSKKRCGDEAPKERKPKLPREKQKRKRTYRPKQRDPNDAERFLEFTTRIKEQSERVFPNISVPYSQLVAQSRLSHVPAKDRKGMSHTKFMEQDQEMSDKLMRKLERIERFRCGKCLVDVEKENWKDHLAADGYTSWLDVFELPFKLSSYSDCLSRLLHLQKIFRIDEMMCPKCKVVRKSPLGHLSHLYVCGLSDEEQNSYKITCEHCELKIFPFSSTAHKKSCKLRVMPIAEAPQISAEDDVEGLGMSLDSSGRLKRKAVRRAEKKMKKIIDDQDQPIDHVKTTNNVSRCSLCGNMYSTLQEALDHIERDHKSDMKDFEDSGSEASFHREESSDTDGTSGISEGLSVCSSPANKSVAKVVQKTTNKRKRTSEGKSRKRNPARKIAVDNSGGHDTEEAKAGKEMVFNFFESFQKIRDKMWGKTEVWTRELNQKHDTPAIYKILPPQPSEARITTPIDLMRSLHYKTVSPKFSQIPAWRFSHTFGQDHKVREDDWKQMRLFENSYNVDAVTMFVGGKVTSLDWAPKTGKGDDYLAVACNNTENQTVSSILEESSPVVVQIFQVQGLDNNKLKLSNSSCKLAYIFPIENGPVLSLKFCHSPPTGKCIGLLAVTTAIGHIQIFSLPKPESNFIARVLALTPSATLKLNDSVSNYNEPKNQASKVTWNKQKENTLLAAGYVCGTVAIWDLNGMEENEEKFVYPINVIQAHLGCVTALDFHYVDDQKLLMTCSLDRRMKVFSLAGIFPIEVSCHVTKSSILCAEWWLHWTAFIVGTDECFSLGLPNLIRQPHDVVFKTQNVINSQSSVMDLSLNNWLNTVLMVSEAGDVFGYKMPQMVHFFREREQKTNELLCSYTDLAATEEDSSEPARLVFCDLSDETITTTKYRRATLEDTDLLRINQVRFNNNEYSHRFYALGYEAGFVRIKFLKHLVHQT